MNLALLVAGWLILFWPALSKLWRYWENSPEFSHCFLIPVISAGVLMANRKRIGALACQRSSLGLAVVFLCLAIYFVGLFYSFNSLQRFAIFGSLIGSVWFLLGSKVLFGHPFPFFYLVLCIPPPFFLLTPLRMSLKAFATRLSSDVLLLLGIPAFPRGNVLDVDGQLLEVADACSGIRSLMAITALSILTAYLLRTGFWKGALLALTAIPVTVAVNVVRINIMTIGLTRLNVDLTTGWPHEVLGIVVFLLAFSLLYVCWRYYKWLFGWRRRASVP